MNVIFFQILLLITIIYLPNVHAIWKPKAGLTWNWVIGEDPNELTM